MLILEPADFFGGPVDKQRISVTAGVREVLVPELSPMEWTEEPPCFVIRAHRYVRAPIPADNGYALYFWLGYTTSSSSS